MGSAPQGIPKSQRGLRTPRSLDDITKLPSSSFTSEAANEPSDEQNPNPNIPAHFTSPFFHPHYNQNDPI